MFPIPQPCLLNCVWNNVQLPMMNDKTRRHSIRMIHINVVVAVEKNLPYTRIPYGVRLTRLPIASLLIINNR